MEKDTKAWLALVLIAFLIFLSWDIKINALLDFNACLSLLIIGFIFALIFARCLMAVVNRGFLLVDYAQEKLYPGGKKQGGKFGLMDMAGAVFEAAKPGIQDWVKGAMGTKRK